MDEQVAVSRDQPCKVVRHEADRVVAAAELGLAYEYRFTGFGDLPAWVAASVSAADTMTNGE